MKPGLDDLGDPAVDDRARVDDDVRVALAGAASPRRRGRRTRPIASAAASRSSRLATVSPTMPSPRNSETPSGSHVPSGSGERGERQAEQEAHQQADEEADDGGDELGRGECLGLADQPARPGRPSGTAGSRSRRRSRRRPRRRGASHRTSAPLKSRARGGQGEPDKAAQRGAKEADVADQGSPRASPRRRAAARRRAR